MFTFLLCVGSFAAGFIAACVASDIHWRGVILNKIHPVAVAGDRRIAELKTELAEMTRLKEAYEGEAFRLRCAAAARKFG